MGEILSLVVAISWTLAAMAADVASRYATVTVVNAVRMWIALPIFMHQRITLLDIAGSFVAVAGVAFLLL